MSQPTGASDSRLDVQVVLADQQEQLDNIILTLQAQQRVIDALVRDITATPDAVRRQT